MDKFGERLKRSREARQLSQSDLANWLGWDKQIISRYETGRAMPGADNLTAIVQALNALSATGDRVTADYLLGLTEKETTQVAFTELSPEERRLIDNIRAGALIEAMTLLTSLFRRVGRFG